MSKGYLNDKQVQQHAGDPKPAKVLPGLGAPLLPSEREVSDPGELMLFEDDDVRQALKQFDVASGVSVPVSPFIEQKRLAAMRLAMMFTLKLAVINTGVE